MMMSKEEIQKFRQSQVDLINTGDISHEEYMEAKLNLILDILQSMAE